MATETIPDVLRGLILPVQKSGYRGLSLVKSTATQGGPEPEQPTRDGFMQLSAMGTADAELDYTVQCVKSGSPTGGTVGGRCAWVDEDDLGTEYKGFLAYNKPTGFRFIDYHSASPWNYGDFEGYTRPHAIRTDAHTVIMVADDHTNQRVYCRTRTKSASAWGAAVEVFDRGADWHACPTVVSIEDNRILCFYLRSDLVEGATTYWTLGMSYSDDDGATWTEGVDHLDGFAVSTASVGDPARLRVVRHGAAYLTLFLTFYGGGAGTVVYHLVSTDLGASVTEINSASEPGDAAVGSGQSWDIVGLPDGRVILFTIPTAGGTTLFQYVKSHPRQAFADDPNGASITATNVSTLRYSGANVAAVLADDGFVYLYWFDDTYESEVRLAKVDPTDVTNVSILDELIHSGRSVPTYSVNTPLDTGQDTNTRLADMTIVPYREKLILLSNNGAQGARNGSLSECYLGAWDNYDWRVQSCGMHNDATGYRSGALLLPIEDPSTVGLWTVTPGGTAPTLTLGSDGFQLNATAGTWVVHRQSTAANDPPMMCEVHVKLDGAASLATDEVALFMRQGDNGTDYSHISLRFTNTGARLYDNGAAAQVGSDITGLTAGQHHAYRVYIENEGGTRKVLVLYKDDTEAVEWSTGPAGSLTNVAGNAGQRVEYGHRVNASTFASNSHLRFFANVADGELHTMGAALSTWANPASLTGRPYSTNPQWLDQGVRYKSDGSSAYIGDAHTIGVHYESGLQNLCIDGDLGKASPSIVYEGTSDGQVAGADQRYVWDFGDVTRLPSSSVAWTLLNWNAGQWVWEYSDDAVSWTSVGTFDVHDDLTSLTYALDGNRIVAGSGSSSGARYVQKNELRGGYVVLDPAGTPASFKIDSNSEGAWVDGSGRPLEIVLEGDLSAVTTSGTCHIIPPRAVLLAHNITATYRYWSLRPPAAAASNTTAEGKFRGGIAFPGYFLAFGLDYAWGRAVSHDAQQTIEEGADGSRLVRVDGLTRRSVEFAWSDGWDMTGADTDPDYIAAKTAYEGLAVAADATVIENALATVWDLGMPVTYVAKAPNAASSDTHVITAKEQILYGWPELTVTRDTSVGDEATSEVVRIDAVTVREIR